MTQRIAVLAAWYALNMMWFSIFMMFCNPYLASFLSFFFMAGTIIDPKYSRHLDILKRPIIYRTSP